MVNKYHKSGRKEFIDGRLRVIYLKDKSTKQYIKKGDSYVALRKSSKKTGGADMEVTKDNIEAAIIVYAKEGEQNKYYVFNSDNMKNIDNKDYLFNYYIAPNGSRNNDKIAFNKFPIDSKGYILKGGTTELEEDNDFQSGKKGFNNTDAIIYCLDVSDSSASAASTKYLVITFIIGDNLCNGLFEANGNPKTTNTDKLKSKKADGTTDDNTENSKTLKEAIEHLDVNSNIEKYGKYFIKNLKNI